MFHELPRNARRNAGARDVDAWLRPGGLLVLEGIRRELAESRSSRGGVLVGSRAEFHDRSSRHIARDDFSPEILAELGFVAV